MSYISKDNELKPGEEVPKMDAETAKSSEPYMPIEPLYTSFKVTHISIGSIIIYKHNELRLVRCSDGGLNFRRNDETFALGQNCYGCDESISIEQVERWLRLYYCD